jgi:leucyl aminopeptidase (aminopeptidase T)
VKINTSIIESLNAFDSGTLQKLKEAANIAVNTSLKVKNDEQVLIISNPSPDVALISAALYEAASEAGARPVLVFQPLKTQIDFTEPAVIAAFAAKPEVVISISKGKLGKDEKGIANPYLCDGKNFEHIFHLLQYGEKVTRSFWSPAVTIDSFIRTVPIDFALLKQRCTAIGAILDEAVSVHIKAAGGTDIKIGLKGRKTKSDDGDFSMPGSGGNLPAGEAFISPENNTAEGVIVFDGSISVHDGDILIKEPVICTVEGGFVREIRGGKEADALKHTIELAETNALEFEQAGKLPKGSGAIYKKNARNIGELGIGLNPEAKITGNMLEDEKAFCTCHFAIGQNYDDDAPSLIHLDSLVKNPTITAEMPDGSKKLIEQDGKLKINA